MAETLRLAGEVILLGSPAARKARLPSGSLGGYNLGNGSCRGVIIAKEISDDLVLAVHLVQGESHYRYKLNVSVEQVS